MTEGGYHDHRLHHRHPRTWIIGSEGFEAFEGGIVDIEERSVNLPRRGEKLAKGTESTCTSMSYAVGGRQCERDRS